MGIVAAGNNGTVAGKFATHDNFAMIAKFRYHSENHCVRNFLLLFFFIQTTSFFVFLISILTAIILVWLFWYFTCL